VNSPYGITFSHNGNLVNAAELKTYLDLTAHRHINTDSDSEVMLNIFAAELNKTGEARVNSNHIFEALTRMCDRCIGGYACTGMLAGYGLFSVRDPHGIRPFVWGRRPSANGSGYDYMMASESVALKLHKFKDIQDLKPGQAIIIPKGGEPIIKQVVPQQSYAPDIFEYVYFARPDTIIDGISVQLSREKMGESLAAHIKKTIPESDLAEIDCIIPIPETAMVSAKCAAKYLKKPYEDGFVKNRYVFRTFIMPGQAQREHSVRRKLSPIETKFQDKIVLLIDDSIVRGTTSREIVIMAKEAGAKKIYFASCAPRITHPHIYGIDLASPSELIAHTRDEQEIAKHIGAERVIYQTLPDLKAACAALSPRPNQEFEVGVFCGSYVTPVEPEYFEHLDRIRGKSKKAKEVEHARDAVAAGVANSREIAIVANGAKVTSHGDIMPATDFHTNGLHGEEEQNYKPPVEQMDISIHNFDDFPRA
jgi:amidophosphoribosyltransferase